MKLIKSTGPCSHTGGIQHNVSNIEPQKIMVILTLAYNKDTLLSKLCNAEIITCADIQSLRSHG